MIIILQYVLVASFLQAAERTLQEYGMLLAPEHSSSQHQAVCDRCLQPIDETTYRGNIARMEADVVSAADERSAAATQSSVTQVQPLTSNSNLTLRNACSCPAAGCVL